MQKYDSQRISATIKMTSASDFDGNKGSKNIYTDISNKFKDDLKGRDSGLNFWTPK